MFAVVAVKQRIWKKTDVLPGREQCFESEIYFWQVRGQDYNTSDGTCIRDYIHVTDLVDAHVKAMDKAERGKVSVYNVGTGKGTQYFRASLFIFV